MSDTANLKGTVITTRGLQLIAKLAGAAGEMEFTGVKVGTGYPQEGTDPSELTHLVSYKMDGMIAEYGYDDETKDAYVIMQLTNTDIESGFIMTEIGLYAEDPDLGEILYAYLDLSDDPNHIMPAETGRIKTVQMKLHVIVGEATEIHATINPNSQVTRKELNKVIGTILTNIEIPISGWQEQTYTIENAEITPVSTIYVGYAFDSIFAAQKANIRGKTEAGKLILSAKKTPAQTLVLDEVRILNLREAI